MRVLVYKRTHPGDPDQHGRFGIEDCMGRVRQRPFDAVIGVGGIGVESVSHGLAGKVNWIGIGAQRVERGLRGPVITFKHFLLLESKGPSFKKLAPTLARRMYGRNARVVMGFSAREMSEVLAILALAQNADPSARSVPRSIKLRRQHDSCRYGCGTQRHKDARC